MRPPNHEGGPGDHREGHPEGVHQGRIKIDILIFFFIFMTYITNFIYYLFIFYIFCLKLSKKIEIYLDVAPNMVNEVFNVDELLRLTEHGPLDVTEVVHVMSNIHQY